MDDIKELFGKLVEHETTNGIGAAESMKAVWSVIKDRSDPFSEAIRNVIIDRMTNIRRTANNILRLHREIFSSNLMSEMSMDDQLIDFLASQEKQVKIAEEILRDDLGVLTES